jgi:hypothetical protein
VASTAPVAPTMSAPAAIASARNDFMTFTPLGPATQFDGVLPAGPA